MTLLQILKPQQRKQMNESSMLFLAFIRPSLGGVVGQYSRKLRVSDGNHIHVHGLTF